MALSNAELLDVVRKLRMYMSSMDNIHSIISSLDGFDDTSVVINTGQLVLDIAKTNSEVIAALKAIESSKSYRSMLKSYNMDDSLATNGD